jgi:hypothetical protein
MPLAVPLAVSFSGIAVVVAGVVVLPTQKGLGVAMLLGGFAVVGLASWLSTKVRRRGGGSKGA